MSKLQLLRRSVAVGLCAALALSAVQPAVAAPLPVAKNLGMETAVETIQYRRGRSVAVRRNRGVNGAGVAAIIGAVAIGAAAIAASNADRRRQRRAEREAYYYGGYPQGYAPVQQQYYYTQQPQQYYAPQQQYYGGGYYQPQPQRRDRWQQRRQPTVDPGSPYAVQRGQVRQQRQWTQPRYQQQYPAQPLNPQGNPYDPGYTQQGG